jgi:hypothetical protein
MGIKVRVASEYMCLIFTVISSISKSAPCDEATQLAEGHQYPTKAMQILLTTLCKEGEHIPWKTVGLCGHGEKEPEVD